MLIAVTGATGFLGRHIVNRLLKEGHRCRCWFRPASDREGFVGPSDIEWITGELNNRSATENLVANANAVVHCGVHWGHGDGLVPFAEANITGTLRLMEAAANAGVARFVFVASCAVHELILDDRPLDEAHPLWPTGRYGAYKAAIEKFVHSFGLGRGWGACSLRPTGIYGLNRPVQRSRWFDLVRNVVAGQPIARSGGGKEVHAADCAEAVHILLNAPLEEIAGQAFNCYDMYVAEQDVARIASDFTGSPSPIATLNKGCRHQIDTSKIRALGMRFGGRPLLKKTVKELLDAVRNTS